MSRVVISSVLAGLLCGNSSIAVSQVFQGIGHLPGGDSSRANGVSADGSVVVGGSSSATSGAEAFIWDPVNGIQALTNSPGGFLSSIFANAVSADGRVVVGHGENANGEIEAFIWDAVNGMRGLGALSSLEFSSQASDVSADGSVVVGHSINTDGNDEAFIWDAVNGMQELGVRGRARGVSADGLVVVGGGINTDGNHEAFIWDATNGMQGLGDLPGGAFRSGASDISPDGKYVVGRGSTSPDGGDEPFIWDATNGFQCCSNLSSYNGVATGVSADGSVVIGGSDNEAFIWDPVNWLRSLPQVLADDYGVNLNLTGWELTIARGVSDDGNVIVGWGRNPDNEPEAWRIDLNAPMFDKWLLTGPDRNRDGMADLAISAGESELVEYTFKIRINRPDLAPVLVQDVVGPEWYVISCVPERRSDMVTVRSSRRSGTMIEWQPEGNRGSLEVTIRTRGQSSGRRLRDGRRNALVKLVPGALVLNDGAYVFVPKPPYFEDGPNPLVTPKLCVAVVEDLNGDGIDPTGNGDEDRDGLTDLYEACELGTNPSNPDTDGDGVADGRDPEPLNPRLPSVNVSSGRERAVRLRRRR